MSGKSAIAACVLMVSAPFSSLLRRMNLPI
jgi:hypothetical protein